MQPVVYGGLRTTLLERLQQRGEAKTRDWWQSYVKGGAPFLGVNMDSIRTVLHQWHKDGIDGKIDTLAQVDLALALFEGKHTEEKLAGTLFLQEVLLPLGAVNCGSDVDRFGDLFDSGRIYDWNTCDWFCVKVLATLIEMYGEPCADHISRWRSAGNLWRARASLVPFAKVASESVYYPLVRESCRVLIRRPERFAKTAVGWVLREVSRYDEDFVLEVVAESVQHFSLEALKNATRYLGDDARRRYRQMLNSA